MITATWDILGTLWSVICGKKSTVTFLVLMASYIDENFYFMIIWDHLSGTICKPLGIITWRQQSWLIIYTEACALLSLGKHKRILILPRDMSKCKAPASVVITRWTKMYPDFQEYGRVHLWKKPTCERECRGTVFVNKKTQLFMWIFCSEMTLHNIPKDQFSEFEWISCHRFTNRGSK